MNLREVEEQVAELDLDGGFEFVFDLLRAYGHPKASISRLKSGSLNRSDEPNEVLWRSKVYFRYVEEGEGDLHALIDDAAKDARVLKAHPRFLIVRDPSTLVAVDQVTGETLDIPLDDLKSHTAFFLPWSGIEKTQLHNTSYADVKAAERMARLYDEIAKTNEVTTEAAIHELNVFFSRLLFCFFAEDTGVFEKSQFTNAVASLTTQSGDDLHEFLDDLFEVLNTDDGKRVGVAAHFAEFPYVNGRLFEKRTPAAQFSSKARSIVLECGELDWSQINPDIFGSMIQAVVHPSQRESLGMHYTSVENIMKVLRPLFLDDLDEAFATAETPKQLSRLLERIGEIKVFDPACGSGNFLIIAYKELRRLEHKILARLAELDPKRLQLFSESVVKLDHFYGIEIDDFAHEVATLSLWLAKHQMNIEFGEQFGVWISLVPLRDTGKIICGNAARLDWLAVCPTSPGDEIYVCGNPPYLGSSMQRPEHRQDFSAYFGTTAYPKTLDYVALWFLAGSDYVAKTHSTLAFVSTNSICQGEQVALIWPSVLQKGVQIAFAHQSFLWTNSARGGAGVTCVVVGLALNPGRRSLFNEAGRRAVTHISPYLADTPHDTIVERVAEPLSEVLPPMVFGSKPTDGGYLNLTASEKVDLLESEPGAARFIRRYVGAQEFLSGIERYCLWIDDSEAELALSMPEVRKRIDGVAETRQRSPKLATRKLAAVPFRFAEVRNQDGESILVPRVSSERRDYIPIGFVDADTIVSDLAQTIPNAAPWVYALIQARMHMVWARTVSGRMKSDIRYSAVLVYNTFPVPELTSTDQNALTAAGFGVLRAREESAGATLAELYAPGKMPPGLRAAHTALDDIVDRLYRSKPFASDDERLAALFELYSNMKTQPELEVAGA